MVNLRQILLALRRHEVEFLVVGGTAAVLHGVPYATFDLDIVHRRTPENVEKLGRALSELSARYRARPDLSPQPSHLLSDGHQLLTTAYGSLDVLGAIEGARGYDALIAYCENVQIAKDVSVAVLSLEWLMKLKEGARDPKHQLQLAILKRTAEERRRS